MRESTVKTILGILVTLVAAYGLFAYFDRGLGGESAGGGPVGQELSRVQPDSVRSVRMIRTGDTVHLRREEGGWRVDGHPADSATVERLRRALGDTEVGTLASRNPENHPRLGVGDSALTVEITSPPAEPARLVVGRQGPVSGSGYLRLPGSDEVYIVRGELASLLRKGEDGWRDQLVARVDTGRIAALHGRRGDDRWVLRKEEGVWTLEGRSLGRRAVSPILSRLVRLTATEFAADSARVADPDRTLTGVSAEGDTLVRLLLQDAGEATRKHRLATPDGRSVWLVPTYEADQLVPTRDRFTGDGGSG